jgi:coenzyme PQQ precursor peptide PqqA
VHQPELDDFLSIDTPQCGGHVSSVTRYGRRMRMQQWHTPEVVEQEVGLEVTSYLPAELDHG